VPQPQTYFPSWTNCSEPQNYFPIPVLNLVLVGATGLGVLIAMILGGLVFGGIDAALASVCLAAISFCYWWLDIRLICLGGDRSATGAIYHLEPPVPDYDPSDADKFFSGFDTDYSFNLLLCHFSPRNQFPQSYVTAQNKASTPTTSGQLAAAFSQLETEWPTLNGLVPTNVPFSAVADTLELIVAQPGVAGLGMPTRTENAVAPDDVVLTPPDVPTPGSDQHFMIHCEIEGRGMYDLLVLLWSLFGLLVAAAALSWIPVAGWIIALIAMLLALLGLAIGVPALENDQATPPQDGNWGGQFNAYENAASDKDPVDIAYIFGRWVYDSLHQPGGNELHPIHYMLKVGTALKGDIKKGIWPAKACGLRKRLDQIFVEINSPTTPIIQSRPENQWTIHPLLDGCLGETPYPQPQPPPVIV
jgi:hypothetical protein